MNIPSLTIRADLAHITPTRMQVIAPVTSLREVHGQVGKNDSQLYFGEYVDVYEIKNGRAWVQSASDKYVGFVSADALSDRMLQPTHRVTTLGAYVYPDETIKAIPLMRLPIGAYIARTGGLERGFVALNIGGRDAFIHDCVLARVEHKSADFVATAAKLLGVPYLWGGRTNEGIDCSGLVQLALSFSGKQVDRDTEVQERNLAPHKFEGTDYQRGDILYFPGHVGIMSDTATMLHANAGSMSVRYEMLDDYFTRTGHTVTSAIRLPLD